MFVNSDFTDLLNLFNDNNVRYMVVGGYAITQHAEPRFTKDLDLWISTDSKNAEAVFTALSQFGAPLENMSYQDFSEEGFVYQIGVPPVRVDIVMGIDGVQFEDAWQRRFTTHFSELSVNFISRMDLLTNKLASGRPQDLIDADVIQNTKYPKD